MTNMSAAKQNDVKIEDIEANYLEICRQLNMDKETEKAAWQSYVEVSQNCTLQGDPIHWLCCAVYAACRESYTPTVGNSNALVTGNCVSLTKLLRSCNISINEFCNKIKVWANVKNTSKGLRVQIERLEQSVHVSLCVYQKYEEIFPKLFVISPNERKKKKAKPGRCSAGKLYDFCWCLFIAAKGEEPNRRTDLVLSLHLLLCCIDLIFVDAVLDDRRDIIRSDFPGLPSKWNSEDFDPSMLKDFCVIRDLCELVSADYVEVANLKRLVWKNILAKFIKHKTLLCNVTSEIISNIYFEPNLKSLNNTYEQYILSVGEFDERIFLNSEKDKSLQLTNSCSRSMPGTPVSSAAAINYLESITMEDISKDFYARIGDKYQQMLNDRLDRLKAIFLENYNADNEKISAEKIFELASVLYYKFLHKIIPKEMEIKPQLDYKVILEKDTLHETLIVCCVEIVLCTYVVKLEFPWVLDCFKLSPYLFYRIIEIVVVHHDGILHRSVIAHLKTIESTCLDSLAWQANSSLWEAIKNHGNALPSYEQVDHRNVTANNNSNHRRLEESRLSGSFFQSPSTTIVGSLQQPEVAESARRDLFNAGASTKNRESDKATESIQPSSRPSSLFLFFRKFYELAYERISKLCEGLQMKNEEHLSIIWAIFEHCIVNQTEIMRDRHLDQIIMCAIYVLIKVKDIPKKKFAEIMAVGRQVLKATSSIYRNVLLGPEGDGKQPRYGDIIKFYNSSFVQSVSPFALNFADKTKQEKNLLSPHPPDKLLSPMKVGNRQFYVQSLDKRNIPISPKVITFEFNRSPAKDQLQLINEKVNGTQISEDTPLLAKKRKTDTSGYHNKLLGIIQDRKGVDKD